MTKQKKKLELLKEKGWVTVAEAARMMGLSYSGAYRLVKDGILKTFDHPGAARYVSVDSIKRHLGPEMARLLNV